MCGSTVACWVTGGERLCGIQSGCPLTKQLALEAPDRQKECKLEQYREDCGQTSWNDAEKIVGTPIGTLKLERYREAEIGTIQRRLWANQ